MYTSVPRIFCLDLGLLNTGALTANVDFVGEIYCLVDSWVRLALPENFNQDYGPRLDAMTARESTPSRWMGDGCTLYMEAYSE